MRVALVGNNSVGYIKALLDIWNHGDCAVLLDGRVPMQTLIEMMREASVSACMIGTGLYQAENNQLPCDIQFTTFDDTCTEGIVIPSEVTEQFCENYSSAEAVVIYSSGTTGQSKGIILSHYAIHTNAAAIIDYMKPAKDDCIYIAKTLSHSSTLTGELLVGLKSHVRILLTPTVIPPRVILSNIRKNRVTILGLNPTLLSMLTDEVERSGQLPETLRTIYVSGSILNDRIYEKAHCILTGINILNVYGLSEAGPRVSAQRFDSCKGNSVGKAIRGVEIAVVNENGEILRGSAKGMIHVKTPSLFSGYISGGQKHTSFYKDWLNTGDIGFWDTSGELHIVGRQDDVIIIDAHKIYPSEIERHILQTPGVMECVVTGIQRNEHLYLGCLYVGNASPIDIRKYLSKHLPIYEIPKLIANTNNIPKNRNGKMDKNKVEEALFAALERKP